MTVSTETKHGWYLLQNLVSRDFKLQYRRSVLGVLWSFLNPLLTMIVMSAVFSQLFRYSIEYYPVYFILGNTLFHFMTDAVNQGMKSIINSAPLIKKIKVDKMIFPTEKVLFSLVNYAISLIAIACVFIFFQVPPTIYILLAPVPILCCALFAWGLGLLFSALAVYFRDMLHIWGVLQTLWMYMTPIFYPVSILSDWMMSIMNFNPLYHYVTYIRNVVVYGICPSATENLICVGMAVITFIVGFLVFKKLQKKFVLYI